MKIFFNQSYSSKPYLNKAEDSFGTAYCGAGELVALLMLHGGIVGPCVSAEERQAVYHNHMKECINPEHLFWKSFSLDPIAASNAVLAWRDTLVRFGWDLKSGTSTKLTFIREMEPEGLPLGMADCWRAVLQEAGRRPLLPEGSEVVVTQPRETLEPVVAVMLDGQARHDIKVYYAPCTAPIADGNLGRVQQWLLDGQRDALILGAPDETLQLLRFENEDTAMRYVATRPATDWDAYCCQQPKRFDNVLRLLGQPVGGSTLGNCEPQVVQLFALGNGIFEYPLNLNRILAWLNAPIHPLPRSLRRQLSEALTSSGGVFNDEWQTAIKDYTDSLGEDDKMIEKTMKGKIETFLPLRHAEGKGTIPVRSLKAFNKALRHWATGLLAMEEFPYDGIVRDQLGQLGASCAALLSILEAQPQEGTVTFIDLQRWCQSLSVPRQYAQYRAEAGCRFVIAAEGDIHSQTGALVWFCMEDDGMATWPFDFLTEIEYRQLTDGGVCLYDKRLHSLMRQEAVRGMLLHTRRLTLVEAAKMHGEPLRRHPLLLQLQEAVYGGLDGLMQRPVLPDAVLEKVGRVDNRRPDDLFVQLEDGVVPPARHELGRAESYSGAEMLLWHPFDHVCQYSARLKDLEAPTMADLGKTKGNVAHRMIEKLFTAPPKEWSQMMTDEGFRQLFAEAVDEKGLMLRQPEHVLELREMEVQMKGVLTGLQQIIVDNDLTVDGCEYTFRTLEWTEAGNGVRLDSRADMLLSDAQGGKVVFDFKWTGREKKYTEKVGENRALQLAVYRRLAEVEFGVGVRTAYILLPALTFISADEFVGQTPVSVTRQADVMQEAAAGYAFRLTQLAEGRIERAEGRVPTESEYGSGQEAQGWFPLEEYNGCISDSYLDYKKLR